MQIRPLLENLARLIEKRTKMRGLIWAESNILLSSYSSADIGFRILVSALKADTWTAKLLNENPFRLAKFTMAQKINVFFFDPQSPPPADGQSNRLPGSAWRRGSNKNTDRLLRQYFPKGADTSGFKASRL